MAVVTLIPAGTYPPQSRDYGPANVPAGVTGGVLAMDTANYDADPGPPQLVLGYDAQLSTDGGLTYSEVGAATWSPPNAAHNGPPAHTTSFTITLPGASPGGGQWKIKGTLTVSGQAYTAANPCTLTTTP